MDASLKHLGENFEQMREGVGRMSGLEDALTKIRKRMKAPGGLPRSLKAALAQGADGALARYKETISGLALVAALFLVGSLEQTISPPDVVGDRLWQNETDPGQYAWDPVAISYGTLLVAADACFFFCIMFYGHMTHYLNYMFHRDADFLVWLLEVDFEMYIKAFSAGPLVLGLILYSISIVIVVSCLYPWYLVCPIHLAGLLLSIHLGFTHTRLGTIRLERFIKAQTDDDDVAQIEFLLKLYETRVVKWRSFTAKLSKGIDAPGDDREQDEAVAA